MGKEAKYISINEEVYKVKKFKDDIELEPGYAYHVKDLGIVLPFFGNKDAYTEDTFPGPGFYTSLDTEDCEYIMVRPVGKMKKPYKEKNIYELDPEYISQIIQQEGLKDVYDSSLTSEMGDAFIPPISESDNELLRIIKIALQHKMIDIKNYAHRFRSDTDMNNFKRSLLAHNKMSMEKFANACEIFDIKWTITFSDKPGCANPMNYQGSIESQD